MAVAHGKNTAIWLSYTNFSGYMNSCELSIDVDTVEVTTFADVAKTFLEGDYTFTFSFESFFDTTDGGWDDVSFAAAVTNMGDQYVLLAPTGTAQGTEPVYELVCKWTSRPIVTSITDAVKISGTMQGSGTGSLTRGYVLMNETVTATGAETGYNIGAVASGTTSAVTYRVNSLTGDVVIAVEESQDNAAGDAYAAVAAYASGTIAADGITRVTTTGAIEAWRRVNVTNDPTTASILVTNTTAPAGT